MVEEAAGTRMYEAKKQAAQKTIEKKDAKLRELNDVSVLNNSLLSFSIFGPHCFERFTAIMVIEETKVVEVSKVII